MDNQALWWDDKTAMLVCLRLLVSGLHIVCFCAFMVSAVSYLQEGHGVDFPLWLEPPLQI
jgi:hypothetical protein